MITSGILALGYLVLHWIVGLFPISTGFPAEVNTAMSTIGGYASTLNPILPFDTMAVIIGLLVIIELGILSWKTLRWGLSYVPFVGGK